MDTDSFICTTKTEDFYKDIRNDLEAKFDTSDYSDERINLYNKKSLGFFKDELNGKLMTEFVNLCSKVYCYRRDQVESSHNKAKGVSSQNLTIEHYKNVLLSGASLYGNRTMLRSKAHKISTSKIYKKILCGKDNKRKRNVNETQFSELSNEDHGTTPLKHQRLIEKDILENVEWLVSNSFCLGEMIQNNYVNGGESLDSHKFQKEHIKKELFYNLVELEMFYYD